MASELPILSGYVQRFTGRECVVELHIFVEVKPVYLYLCLRFIDKNEQDLTNRQRLEILRNKYYRMQLKNERVGVLVTQCAAEVLDVKLFH